MSEDPGKETAIVPILERQVVVRQLNSAQSALMAREAGRLSRGSLDGKAAMLAVARIMDLIEQAVVQQEDRDWLVEQMTQGNLEMDDIMPVLNAFNEPAPTVGPVRRGRTPTKR